MSELLDVFDSKMNHIGVKDRIDVHKNGFWHQTFHCWIIREENEKQYVVFQIRDKSKDVAANKLDITAAGHLKAGETKEDGVRELQEELGLTVDFDSLNYIGVRITASESNNQINKEFAHVFLLQNNTPLENYKFPDGEVAGLVQMEISDGLKLCSGQINSVDCKVVKCNNGIYQTNVSSIAFEHLIPRIDSYYYKIFIMAERYFQGNEYISI